MHDGKGSYANELNEYGSDYGYHQDYVNRAIYEALYEWQGLLKERYQMTITK